jgi:hypothetical protein
VAHALDHRQRVTTVGEDGGCQAGRHVIGPSWIWVTVPVPLL